MVLPTGDIGFTENRACLMKILPKPNEPQWLDTSPEFHDVAKRWEKRQQGYLYDLGYVFAVFVEAFPDGVIDGVFAKVGIVNPKFQGVLHVAYLEVAVEREIQAVVVRQASVVEGF